MQAGRLFEIIYLLLERKNITAAELAEHFEVTVRTIYRDIDLLSGAGIPVYASRGKGGGIRLMENFTLSKSLLTAHEQDEILFSLQGLQAIRSPDAEPVLHKLAGMFGNSRSSWLDVDFSRWGGGEEERGKFALLKTAILEKRVLVFHYFSADGGKVSAHIKRSVEPFRLLFKGQSWYLYGFCRLKRDFRIFKITRMKNLVLTGETFDREAPESPVQGLDQPYGKMLALKLEFDACMAFRFYDEFDEKQIEQKQNGKFIVSANFPEGEWLYSYLMSFGSAVRLLEPEEVKTELLRRLRAALGQYNQTT